MDNAFELFSIINKEVAEEYLRNINLFFICRNILVN